MTLGDLEWLGVRCRGRLRQDPAQRDIELAVLFLEDLTLAECSPNIDGSSSGSCNHPVSSSARRIRYTTSAAGWETGERLGPIEKTSFDEMWLEMAAVFA
jgi:hypothetical protein